MKASELIFKLKELKEIHGDLPVKTEVRQNDYLPWDDDVEEVEHIYDAHAANQFLRIV